MADTSAAWWLSVLAHGHRSAPASVLAAWCCGRCYQLCNYVEAIKISNNNCQDKSPNLVLPQQVIDLMDEVVHGMSIVYDAVSTCDAGVSSAVTQIEALRAENRIIRRMLRNILGVIDGDANGGRCDVADGDGYDWAGLSRRGLSGVAPDRCTSVALSVPLQAMPPWDTDNG